MTNETIHNDNQAIEHADAHGGEHEHAPSYGQHILIWLTLLGLTVMTVAVAGIELGAWTLPAALFIAAIKSALVINVFMHIKYEDILFKIFILLTIAVMVIVFVITSFDYLYR
jgi:cytochrome c oxidase subunit IV